MLNLNENNEKDNLWEVPLYETHTFFEKRSRYCVCIPVINEGKRIEKQLERMRTIAEIIDIIILDGGSTDGSVNSPDLIQKGVRALLVKKGHGKLSAQLRMGYEYALRQGYEGVITIDGNGKDNVEAILDFSQELDNGLDFVQGSRFIPGGKAINTPIIRLIAIKLIHAPIISLLSGYKYTDTTNGFRAYSRRLLLDKNIGLFRNIFDTYELLAYLSVKAPRLGYNVKEIPVSRVYPKGIKTPTKISSVRGNYLLLKILYNLYFHKYDID